MQGATHASHFNTACLKKVQCEMSAGVLICASSPYSKIETH